jgi:hypothetical protein
MDGKRRREIEEEERYRAKVRASLDEEQGEAVLSSDTAISKSQESGRRRRFGCLPLLGYAVLALVALAFIGNLLPETEEVAPGASSTQPERRETSASQPNTELPGVEITRQEYGDDWPYSVESGRLYCDGPGSNVVMESNGTVYALNGRAMGNAEERRYVVADRDTISLTDDQGFYTVGSHTKIIERGLAMC